MPARAGRLAFSDGELDAVYLLRSHHGRGLGRALIARSAQFWLDSGGATLGLWVLRGNSRAQRFCRQLGGIICDHRRFSIGPAEFDEDGYLFRDMTGLASIRP